MAELRVTVPTADHEVELRAGWTDDAPGTRKALADALPVEGPAAWWGDELYSSVPLGVGSENARTVVDVGTLAS